MTEFLKVGGSLLMVKENAIYRFQLADQIDPSRTNISIPNVQQKLYSIGSSSEIVGRVLMTAKYLFEKGMLDRRFDSAVLMPIILQFFDEIVAACAIFDELVEEQDAAVAAFEERKVTGAMLLLPSTPDVAGKAKAFIQRIEHGIRRLLTLCQAFYALPPGKAWFDSFVETATAAHDLQQPELDRIRHIAKFAQFIRNCRHCVEHPKVNQRIVVSDFKLTPKGEVEPPFIEIVHPSTPEPAIPLFAFMRDMTSSLISVGEALMAFLASRHVEPSWEKSVVVAYFAEGQRRNPHVGYYFAMDLNGALTPVG